tara:strand:+ start:20546 stop:21421 length:876 start_codon:yes stop_codon:yes gene_type:complete
MKRIVLFIATNILVMAAATILMKVLGVGNYIEGTGLNYSSLMIICLIWGGLGSFVSLLLSKWMAKTMMGLQEISVNGPYGSIVRKVHEYAKRSNLEKMPEVYVYNSPEPNAFATGPSRNNSLVAVSTGLLEAMSEDEVEAVLAHEVSHIANGDMVTMALVQGVVNAFVMFFARVAAFAIDNALRGDDDNGKGLGHIGYFVATIVLQIVFGILAAPITMWFSRWREFRADAGSARLVGKEKMIAALEALKRNTDKMLNENKEMEVMQISSKKAMIELFASHPPLDKRIAALR